MFLMHWFSMQGLTCSSCFCCPQQKALRPITGLQAWRHTGPDADNHLEPPELAGWHARGGLFVVPAISRSAGRSAACLCPLGLLPFLSLNLISHRSIMPKDSIPYSLDCRSPCNAQGSTMPRRGSSSPRLPWRLEGRRHNGLQW